jgi:prepilin peptidase CpaA
MNFFQIVTVAIVAAAVVTDLKSRRIPNALTFGAAIAAFAVHTYMTGSSGLVTALAGWLVGVAIFFPVFALGGMGAGDIKLLAAVGAWLGPAAAAWVALFSGVAGGFLALIVAAFSGYLGKAFKNIWYLLTYWRVSGVRPLPELMLSSQKGPRLAYAIPVLAGLMVTLWLR